MVGKIYESVTLGAEREIRLLRIRAHSNQLGSRPNEEIVDCELFTAALDSKCAYEALSYVWGDASVSRDILINRMKVQVTANLWDALVHLRRVDGDLVIWVDALCINQSDAKEKAAQVMLMTDIYKGATTTYAWIGTASDNSDRGMAEIAALGAFIADRNGIATLVRSEGYKNQEGERENFEAAQRELAALVEVRLETPVQRAQFPIEACRDLLARPYWRRAWVIQEVAVSGTVEVVCGRAAVPFTSFHGAVVFLNLMCMFAPAYLQRLNGTIITFLWPSVDHRFLERLKAAFPVSPSRISGIRFKYQEDLHSASTPSESMSLARILLKIHGVTHDDVVEATDPRDRIFALLGLVRDRADLARLTLVPDYEVTTRQVFTAAARAMITLGHVDLLGWVNPHKTDALPSWVPNWETRLDRPFQEAHWKTSFCASGTRPEHAFPGCVWHTGTGDQLTLQGHQLDVLELVEPLPVAPPGVPLMEVILTLAAAERFSTQSNARVWATGEEIYASATDRDEAHMRLPVADQVINHELARAAKIDFVIRGYNGAAGHMRMVAQGNLASLIANVNSETSSYYTLIKDFGSCPFFLTRKGYVGRCPAQAQAGDVVVVFRGAKFPTLLRKNGNGTFSLVGEVFVHGIMYGEAMEKDEVGISTFVLE